MRWSLVARNNFGPQVYWGDCFTHGSCYILRADERGGGQSLGLYFNTVETARMVFRLNKHFGPTAGGGNIGGVAAAADTNPLGFEDMDWLDWFQPPAPVTAVNEAAPMDYDGAKG